MKTQLVIPAAGMGRRLGLDMPKALAPLAGKPLIAVTLERLLAVGFDAPVLIAVPDGCEARFQEALAGLGAAVLFVAGGAERQQSVRGALDALDADTALVAIHDAARPFVPVAAAQAAIAAAREHGGATLAARTADTILVDNGAGFLEATPDRGHTWACQTPQVFQVDIIRRAHALASDQGLSFTDDATLARHAGCPVKLVDGGRGNYKITTMDDFLFATYLLERDLP